MSHITSMYIHVCVCVCVCSVAQLCPTLYDPMNYIARILSPWKFPGKNIGVGCHFLLQGIFLTQRSNPPFFYLLHWQADSLPLSHLGNPFMCPCLDGNVVPGWTVTSQQQCCTVEGKARGLRQLTRQPSLGIWSRSTNTKPLLCDRLCAPSGNTRVRKILLPPWKIQSLV